MSKEFSIQRDRYSEKREGKSNLYEISCATCQTPIMIYQKDGKGDLIRCYQDRIYAAKNMRGIEEGEVIRDTSSFNKLVCGSCDSLIGTSILYKPEKRPAFHMIRGAFSRKPYKPDKRPNLCH